MSEYVGTKDADPVEGPRQDEEKGSATMVKDPVCGMMIDERTAAGTSVYGGQMYYFCSVTCKQQFDREPSSFVAPADQQPHPSPESPSADSDYMRGGKGRRDEVGRSGVYPADSPDAPRSAPIREPGEYVHHAGGSRKGGGEK